MTTVREIISDALLEIGVSDDANNVADEHAEHGRRALNRMLGAWSQRGRLRPLALTVDVPLTGASSYTIGPSGVVVALRPLRVEIATYIASGGGEAEIDVLGPAQWAQVYSKAQTGMPACVHYSATLTNGTLYVHPIGGSGVVRLLCRAAVESYSSLNDAVMLPDGYEEALVLGLADAISGSFGKQATPDIRRRLTAALSGIRAANTDPVPLSFDIVAGQSYEIERGY